MSPSLIESNPLVSIVICTYNGEAYLEQTLESVLNQTYSNIEVIAVDDGSTDGTRTILERTAGRDDRIRLVYQNNTGLPGARDTGFLNAKGEWVAIIDQDDICYPDRIAEQLRTAEEYPNAGLIFCNTDYIDEAGRIIGEHLSKFSLPAHYIPKGVAANLLLSEGCFIDSEAFFMRRSYIQEVGLMNKSLAYSCDFDFFVRAGFVCSFAYSLKHLSAWRIHTAQQTQTNKKKYKETFSNLTRYYWHPEITWWTRGMLTYRYVKTIVTTLLRR